MRRPRRFWTILLFAPSKVGRTVSYKTNWKLAPKWGFLTPALVEDEQ